MIIYGPGVNNYLSRYWHMLPFIPLVNGLNPPFQFVHEDDVVNFILALLQYKKPGAFNLAPDDTISYREIARLMGKKTVRVPKALAYLMTWLGWRLKWLEMPPGALYYTMYPWTVANCRSKEVPGFSYRYTTRQSLQALLDKQSTGKHSIPGSNLFSS